MSFLHEDKMGGKVVRERLSKSPQVMPVIMWPRLLDSKKMSGLL